MQSILGGMLESSTFPALTIGSVSVVASISRLCMISFIMSGPLTTNLHRDA